MTNTVPMPPYSRPRPFQFTLRQLMGFVTLVAVALGLIMWFVKLARIAEEDHQCQNNLKRIALGILNYEQMNGCLPPAYVLGKDGTPAHSWRRLICTYLESQPWDEILDSSEPWNGPKNSQRRIPLSVFRCPAANTPEPCATNYVVVVGPNTMWPGSMSAKIALDGSDKGKILVIEIVNSDILWMEPRDLTLDEALTLIQPKKRVGIGSWHPSGIHYITVAGTVGTLDPKIDRESLRRLLTREPAKTKATTGKNPTSR